MSSRRDFLFGRRRRDHPKPAPQPPAPETPAPEPSRAPPREARQPGDAPAPPRRRPTIPVLRPPGAVEEQAFLDGCTRCGDCAQACPYDAIVPAPARMRSAAGTPMIDPMRSPCMMCEDAPCVEACEPNVLSWEGFGKMGFARVQQFACLAWTDQLCSVCAEHCPVPGAITMNEGKPTIDEQTCTGCGVCQHVCPAPVNAIVLMPSPERNGLGPMPEVRW